MTTTTVSVYAGRYQGPVSAVPGYRLLGSGGELVVRDAGTADTAALYADAAYAGALVADPVPAAAGLGLAGLDAAGTLTFWADAINERYDIAVRFSGSVGAPLRVHVGPDPREAAASSTATAADVAAIYVQRLGVLSGVVRNASGQVASLVDGGVAESYGRDAAGRVVTVTVGATSRAVSRNAAGQVTGVA